MMIKSDDAVLNYQLEGACPSAFPSEHFETGDIKAGRMAGVEDFSRNWKPRAPGVCKAVLTRLSSDTHFRPASVPGDHRSPSMLSSDMQISVKPLKTPTDFNIPRNNRFYAFTSYLHALPVYQNIQTFVKPSGIPTLSTTRNGRLSESDENDNSPVFTIEHRPDIILSPPPTFPHPFSTQIFVKSQDANLSTTTG
ncbi:hypothetical protein FA13DRAFT_1800518 [Coprinellus micaceus]|uniref:Uncharacterized protein n=1 Tax=Coprinellus micaceus TaxID=71717 RepID=A0A4Y7R5T4_COPMI|nr:hypothetical protein FA13DRAFT_1807830 [Coprinellus micaceus]TEB21003.1 hypothetical protein FA13DRAFT_1800518 [Coprinellus micaceus]